MPRVNLVPTDERRKERQRQLYVIPLVGLIAIGGLLGGSYYYYNSKLTTAEEDLAFYQRKNAEQAQDVAELKKYEDLKNQRQSRLSAVTTIYQARFRWSRMLDDLSFVVPEQLSLIKITGRVPGAPTAQQTSGRGAAAERDLEFEGHTRSMPEVAIFMVRLALIPSLSDVTLKLAEVEADSATSGIQSIHFIINASLKVSGETQRTAAAPSTGETGPSRVTPTGTTPTGTSTTPTGTTTTPTTTPTTPTTAAPTP